MKFPKGNSIKPQWFE